MTSESRNYTGVGHGSERAGVSRSSDLQVTSAFWVALSVAIVVFVVPMLPEKYLADHLRLLDILNRPAINEGGSYGGTAYLYRLLFPIGWRSREFVGAINALFVVAVTVWSARASAKHSHWPALSVAWMTSWIAIAAIFVGMLSKESFTIVLMSFAVALLHRERSLWKVVCVAVALAAYGYGVRFYWLAVVAYWVAFLLVFKLVKRSVARVIGIVVVLTCASIAVKTLAGVYLTNARIVLNIGRLENPNIESMILNPLPNVSVFTDVANLVWAWANFLAPVRLLVGSAPQQAAFALWQLVNVGLVLRIVRSLDSQTRRRLEPILLLALALTVVLGAFDGDFGSYTRHQIALLPVVATLLFAPRATDARNVPLS